MTGKGQNGINYHQEKDYQRNSAKHQGSMQRKISKVNLNIITANQQVQVKCLILE